MKLIIAGLIVVGFVTLAFTSHSYARDIYGCAKHEIISLERGACPVGGERMQEISEGYVLGDNSKIISKNMSTEKIKEISDKLTAAMVIYRSPYTGKVQLTPGTDRFGNELEKQYISLDYFCGQRYWSSEPLNSRCKDLRNRKGIVSYRDFYKRHRARGMSKDEIERFWEMYTNQNPDKAKYIY
jgi:hypothetical protein